MSITANAIIEDYRLPLSWGEFLVTIEAKGTYEITGYETPDGATHVRDRVPVYELQEVDVWSADGGKFNWPTMPVDLKKAIVRLLELDRE